MSNRPFSSIRPVLALACGLLLPATLVAAQDAETAGHFGFDRLEAIPVGPGVGPILARDVDGDGHVDLVVGNNHKSRIEVLRQRPDATPGETRPASRVNELPEHWRFERIEVPVSVEIADVDIADVDDDGMLDLVLAGRPGTIQVFRQDAPGSFQPLRRHRVRGLSPTRDGLVVADLAGTDGPLEVASLAEGRINVWPLEADGRMLPPIELSAGEDRVIAMLVDDYDGDGLQDIAGVVNSDDSPLRVWLASRQDGVKSFGPQLRFEAPPLVEAAAVRMPGEEAARMAIIERPTRRVVIQQLQSDVGDGAPPTFEMFGFPDPGQRSRDLVVVDLDGDGLLDVLGTDRDRNAVASWRQVPGRGLSGMRSDATFAQPDAIEAADVDGDGNAEVFVLSAEEGVVGMARVEDGRVGFPEPMALPSGHEPQGMRLVETAQGPVLAVVSKVDRGFAVDLLPVTGAEPGTETRSIDLGRATRGPDSMLDIDADQDGVMDLLLFTEDRPMTVLRGTSEGFEVLDKDAMPQFGLVSAASADNTGRFDIDGDGAEELLVADRNYVRGVRLDPERGWRVVDQLNADGTSKLVTVTVLGDRIVAADREGGRLLLFERSGDGWAPNEEIPIQGLSAESLRQGSFQGGDGDTAATNDLLLVGRDAFAIIGMEGERPGLVETASWRPDDNRTVPHEIGLGDLNGDDHLDLVTLDAGRQAIQILSFSDLGRLVPMAEFKVFESKIFSGGEPREYEPREVLVADVTGDGAEDLVLVAHDRILVYPQSRIGEDG
ncbi:MAG: VCBS repeat-containing protein [Planctomycetota bacterium]|nr:VCBS repeat-containing protein [Planctomycetota bacterium]